jgi:hypothetical protein
MLRDALLSVGVLVALYLGWNIGHFFVAAHKGRGRARRKSGALRR